MHQSQILEQRDGSDYSRSYIIDGVTLPSAHWDLVSHVCLVYFETHLSPLPGTGAVLANQRSADKGLTRLIWSGAAARANHPSSWLCGLKDCFSFNRKFQGINCNCNLNQPALGRNTDTPFYLDFFVIQARGQTVPYSWTLSQRQGWEPDSPAGRCNRCWVCKGPVHCLGFTYGRHWLFSLPLAGNQFLGPNLTLYFQLFPQIMQLPGLTGGR